MRVRPPDSAARTASAARSRNRSTASGRRRECVCAGPARRARVGDVAAGPEPCAPDRRVVVGQSRTRDTSTSVVRLVVLGDRCSRRRSADAGGVAPRWSSSTGWRSVGDEAMTRRTSPSPSAAPAPRSSSALRCSSSSNSRAFSIAMTAWSANVSSSAICSSVNGRTSVATDDDRADRRRRRAAAARASDRPMAQRPQLPGTRAAISSGCASSTSDDARRPARPGRRRSTVGASRDRRAERRRPR